MFHLILTLVYTVPNIYVFFRIKHLFISRQYQRWYIPVYLVVASIYPLSEVFSHRGMIKPMLVLTTVSDYLIPVFLYLFLLVLLFDIFLLLNLVIRIVRPETRKGYSFRLYTLSTMIIVSAAIVIAGVINLNTVRVSKYRIEIPRKHSKMDHLRVAFVSDIHIEQNTRLQFIEQFVRKVNALRSDVMLYGGDLVEVNTTGEKRSGMELVLRAVHAKYGAFGIMGNHEYYGGSGQKEFIRKSGIILLCDTVIRIDSLFYLAGRNDQHLGQRKTINDLLEGIPLDLPVIILDHRPTELQEVSRTEADVQFSGHTHNGQLFPINLITRRIYELSWGYKKINDAHFFVTSGLRLWGPPVKTAGKSEIMLVDICFIP